MYRRKTVKARILIQFCWSLIRSYEALFQNQLFPDNFWYVVAMNDRCPSEKKLEVYRELYLGIATFGEIGVSDPKNRIFFSWSGMTGYGQKLSFYCFMVFFFVISKLISTFSNLLEKRVVRIFSIFKLWESFSGGQKVVQNDHVSQIVLYNVIQITLT